MQNIHSFIDNITERIGKIISYLIIPLIVVIVYSVVMRYVFKNALIWSFEVSLFIFGAYGMLGGAYCLLTESHVNVDILPRKLPLKGQHIIKIISNIVIIAVTSVMVIDGIDAAFKSTLILERSIHQTSFNPQIWWFRWIIPLAAFLVAVKSFSDLLRAFKELSRKRISK